VIRRRMVVHGRVQGVGFRWSCIREADRLGVRGWVRNRPDGTVEAVAEGEVDAVERFVEWLRTGPRPARVDRVEVADEPVEGLDAFRRAD
jgi:acylphosphatase